MINGSLYPLGVLAWLPVLWRTDRIWSSIEIADTFDLKLLHWSTYASILWALIRMVSGLRVLDPNHIPWGSTDLWLPLVSGIFGPIVFLVQLYHIRLMVSIQNHLKNIPMAGNLKFANAQSLVGPLGLGNFLYWLFALYQFKKITIMSYSVISPPDAFRVLVGTLLFAVLIFYRFHSFCMCFSLYHFTWFRGIFKKIQERCKTVSIE